MHCSAFRVVDPNRVPEKDTPRCAGVFAPRVEIAYEESPNFRGAMKGEHEHYVTGAKKGIENLGRFVAEQIRAETGGEEKAKSSWRITVGMRHIDTARDYYEGGGQYLRTGLSCLTGLIYPLHIETEEKIKVRVVKGERLVREYEYRFHRLAYHGPPMIPFNIFVTPLTESWSIGPSMSRMRFEKVMHGLGATVRRDIRRLKCEIAAEKINP